MLVFLDLKRLLDLLKPHPGSLSLLNTTLTVELTSKGFGTWLLYRYGTNLYIIWISLILYYLHITKFDDFNTNNNVSLSVDYVRNQ